MLNALEPLNLIRHFQEEPPEGFSIVELNAPVPAFATVFDLLTTAEPDVSRRIDALPWSRRWRNLLRARTCFIGTTVSEYAPLSDDVPAETLVHDILRSVGSRFPFVIIKDLPAEPALVGNSAFEYSRAVLKACEASGFVTVEGQALAYVPIDFSSIDEFLGRRSHARRKELRRKLRSRANLEIENIPIGDARFNDDEFLQLLYGLYLNVYHQSEIHFDLLTPDFFRAVLRDASIDGVVFTYRAGGDLIGYNLCVQHDDMLVDKYIGLLYPQSRRHNLYTVSWFHNLQYALQHSLSHYVAGWTDPEIKRSLGARFTFTQHAVYARNPIVRFILRKSKRHFEADSQWQAR